MENPYQSPEAEPIPRRVMPASVVVAVVALVVLFGVEGLTIVIALLAGAASVPRAIFQIALAALILMGTVSGHRLAWQWGRILALVGAVLFTLALAMVLVAISRDTVPAGIGVLVLLQVVPLYVVFFAFGRPSAKAFFGLVCPRCGFTTNKAADFFFARAKCKACNNVW